MAGIRLEKVRKVYPDGTVALHGLDLAIADGELLVVVGPSGCGKTTLLRVIAGLETPTSGKVYIGSRDVTDLSPQQRDLAMVFQTYALYPHKTVRQNLEFGLRVRGIAANVIAERVQQVVATLDLADVLDRRPWQLSGGQRQRVALGRAIARQPQAFLLDEPLSNLDARLRVRTRTELVRIHRHLGATMVFVTHDQEEAMTLGDRVAVLNDGQLQQVATPMEVYHRPANTFVAGFIGSPGMNLFPCSLERTGSKAELVTPGFRIGATGLSLAKAPCTLGIRPEELRLAQRDQAELTGRVEVVQPLGSFVIVHVIVGDEVTPCRVTLLAPATTNVAEGAEVGLVFSPNRIHLFDASGRRIDAGD